MDTNSINIIKDGILKWFNIHREYLFLYTQIYYIFFNDEINDTTQHFEEHVVPILIKHKVLVWHECYASSARFNSLQCISSKNSSQDFSACSQNFWCCFKLGNDVYIIWNCAIIFLCNNHHNLLIHLPKRHTILFYTNNIL